MGTAPFRAPWALYEGSDDRQVLRDDLLAIVDEPEFVDTVSNILQDAQGSDEYELYKDLADRKIDYFLIATGGSMDQLVVVRSEDDFRRFIDHMEDHYAADMYVGEDDDRRLVRASSGKFVYHNPARSNPFLDTNNQGYLYNPQFANEWVIGRDRYHTIDKEKVVLWVHATEYDGISDWRGAAFKDVWDGDRFYVGGGANASDFGMHYLFVKYKSTRIFSGDTYFDDYSTDRDEAERFLDCLADKFQPDSDSEEAYHRLLDMEDADGEIDFSELSRSELKSILRKA